MGNKYTVNSEVSTAEFFDRAAKHKFSLLRLDKGKKKSTQPGWQNLWSTDPAQWRKWHADGYNIGVCARPSRLIIVDPDVADGKKGDKNWEAWCKSKGLNADDYPAHTASARGGKHIYFAIPEGVHVNTAGDPIEDVDIILNGQTVAPGSYFDGTAEGKQSGWYTTLSDNPPYTAPQALIDHCTIKPRGKGVAKAGEACPDDTRIVLDWMIANDAIEGDAQWHKIGMVLRDEYGDDPGLELFSRICWDQDVDPKTLRRWNSFHLDKENGVGIGTLRHMASRAGCPHIIRKSLAAMFPPEAIPARLQDPPPIVPWPEGMRLPPPAAPGDDEPTSFKPRLGPTLLGRKRK